jgi:hypothetical protein
VETTTRGDYVARKGDAQLGSRIERSDQPRSLHNPLADNPPHGARRFAPAHPAGRRQWARAAAMAAWAAVTVALGAIAQVIVAIVKELPSDEASLEEYVWRRIQGVLCFKICGHAVHLFKQFRNEPEPNKGDQEYNN